MTNGYRVSTIVLLLSLFHGQLPGAETTLQHQVVVQSALTDQHSTESNKSSVLLPESKSEPKSAFLLNKFSLSESSETKTERLNKTKDQEKKTQDQEKKAKGQNTRPQDRQFIPSEAISEDLSVSFPVDI